MGRVGTGVAGGPTTRYGIVAELMPLNLQNPK